MTILTRAASALLPLALLLPVPALAQTDCMIRAISAEDTPKYTRPNDPWIYRGTDIPIDQEWLFGEMPNGLRYAVRQNDVPPCQVSLRVHIDAGSIHEDDDERGFAHLIEHLIFRESRDFGPAEAIPHFQRLGAALGSDTNAITSPTQTVFKLDLPNADRASLEESVRGFAGMIREPALSTANLAADVPIVLSERREQAGADARLADAWRETFFAGQRLASRGPIGTIATLEAATAEGVRDFHDRWYRPENAVVVLVGDADPRVLAAAIERHFGDWQGNGPFVPQPDFGDPVAPAGSAAPEGPLDVPVGELVVVTEPGQPRSLTFAVLRPWVEVVDNIEYNRGNLLNSVAAGIVNRRLENRARAGGSFLYAAVGRERLSRSVDGTFIAFAPLSEDWQTALADVRGVIADALTEPPSQAEIDQVVAQFDVAFADGVEQSRIQAGSQLADSIPGAVDIREAVASPETFLEVFRGMNDRFTPDRLLAATRELFSGEVVRAMMVTGTPGEADVAQLRAALEAPVSYREQPRRFRGARFRRPAPGRQPGVADFERTAGRVPRHGGRCRATGVRQRRSRAAARPRQRARPGDRAGAFRRGLAWVRGGRGGLCRARRDGLDQFGHRPARPERPRPHRGGPQAVVRFPHRGRRLRVRRADPAGGSCRPALPVRRQARHAELGPRAGRTRQGQRVADLRRLCRQPDRGDQSRPRLVAQRPRPALRHGRSRDDARAATPEGFRETWERLLAQGPVEVAIFGDIDRSATVEALTRTFGALAPRTPLPPEVAARAFAFPAGSDEPFVLTHTGDPDQAAAVIAWPTGGGSAGLVQSRKLDLLAQIFANRLLDNLRERAGAAYSPLVSSNWPLDTTTGGSLFALVQIEPELLPVFFEEAQAIAADLATNGPSADELARVVEPVKQYLNRAQTGHTFWLNQIQGGSMDGNRLSYLRTLWGDYADATPLEIQTLAKRYLLPTRDWQLSVVPEGSAAGGGL